ncbi:MAG: hypothetical protein JNM22_15125 [Saprospiraceae bacterium]|nr:hypothetical protein [Saprospiraceae bacterium]
MLQLTAEFIIYFFVDILFEGILLRIWRGVRQSGFLILSLLTGISLEAAHERFKDSSKPYFLGMGLWAGVAHLLFSLIINNL